jgi:large subunit ribosomal protein L6e
MPKQRKVHTTTGPRFLLKKDTEPKLVGKYYPAEDVPRKIRRSFTPGTAKLRSSITPGTVLILLAGRFRGRRVVFLQQLPSGLLLVTGTSTQTCGLQWRACICLWISDATQLAPSSSFPIIAGPYGVNGVPLRRVNQAYVIATSTKVDVSKVKVPASLTDASFKPDVKEKAGRKVKTAEDFFALTKKEGAAGPSDDRKKEQAAIDGAITLSAELQAYLKSRFALSKGDKPHEMKF